MFRYLAIAALLAAMCTYSLAATGDKPNQVVIPFRNVSSSTKPAGCVVGETKQNADYIFFCATSHHWRRISKGSGF